MKQNSSFYFPLHYPNITPIEPQYTPESWKPPVSCQSCQTLGHPKYGDVPKLRDPFGVPIIRAIVFWGLYWGPLILGNYHIPLPLLHGSQIPKSVKVSSARHHRHHRSSRRQRVVARFLVYCSVAIRNSHTPRRHEHPLTRWLVRVTRLRTNAADNLISKRLP